jgi:hypothetical protein
MSEMAIYWGCPRPGTAEEWTGACENAERDIRQKELDETRSRAPVAQVERQRPDAFVLQGKIDDAERGNRLTGYYVEQGVGDGDSRGSSSVGSRRSAFLRTLS